MAQRATGRGARGRTLSDPPGSFFHVIILIMLIDSHCHLHDREFFTADEAEKMLENAKNNGVEKIICIGTNHADSLAARDFATAHENVFWTYGIHPESTAETPKLEKDNKLVAIGEIGLDYHYETQNRPAQIKLFETMLQIADDDNLPVSFHIREAFDDFFGIIANFPKIRGVVHSFSDNKKNLNKILNTTDFYIGINGLATYSTLPTPPLERILLETDAPFLTPAPNRGKINEPAYIKDIAVWLSTKLGVSAQKISDVTTQNARNIFSI